MGTHRRDRQLTIRNRISDLMSNDPTVGSTQWAQWRKAVDLDDYESRWDRMAERGENPHGEVDFVMQFEPKTALDAGCGFGRVGIELAARGVEIVGVEPRNLIGDLQTSQRSTSVGNSTLLCWRETSLASLMRPTVPVQCRTVLVMSLLVAGLSWEINSKPRGRRSLSSMNGVQVKALFRLNTRQGGKARFWTKTRITS